MSTGLGTVPAPLAVWAERQPEKVALIGPRGTTTYREFDERANRLANAVTAWGVGPGENVAVLLHNCPEFLEALAGLQKLRATLVPINYRLTGPEIDYILRDSDAAAFIVGAEFLDTVRPLYADLPAPLRERIVVVDEVVPQRGRTEPARFRGDGPEAAFEAVLAGASAEAPAVPGGPSGGSMLYTSGTTGRPKGVYRAPGERDATNRLRILWAFRLGNDDRHLVCCPLYHAAPLMLATVMVGFGATLVIMPRFDPERFLQLVEAHRITSSGVVPTVLNRIVSLPEEVKRRYDIASIRSLITAGAPFPYPLKVRCVELFGNDCLFEYYGATETGITTIMFPEDQLRKPGSCGRQAPGSQIRLLDAFGDDVAEGEAGEVYVLGDNMLDGYYKNEAALQRATRDGYVSVGDVARRDADGYYYLVDRRIDMVISGGVNIYPAEVEQALLSHPHVADAAVIGVPDPDWGESLRAYVVRRTDVAGAADLTAGALTAHCAERIADYKRPRSLLFVDELPYSPSGKVLKRELRHAALREAGYDPVTYGLGTTNQTPPPGGT